MLAIQVLVQAVVVASAVLQQQRGGTHLACGMAAGNEVGMPRGVAHIDAHGGVPLVGNGRQVRVQCLAQPGHQTGQRVAEVPVFALAKAVALHHHAAAEGALIRVAIKAGQRGAFGGTEQLRQYRIALLVQGLRGCWPVDGNCTLRPIVVLQTGLVRQRASAHATFSASGCAGSGAASRVSSARLRSTPQR
ncbi:hypothetical protein D3C71_1088450 [compost metagenome]